MCVCMYVSRMEEVCFAEQTRHNSSWDVGEVSLCMYVCICIYVSHTHTHIYIYIYTHTHHRFKVSFLHASISKVTKS